MTACVVRVICRARLLDNGLLLPNSVMEGLPTIEKLSHSKLKSSPANIFRELPSIDWRKFMHGTPEGIHVAKKSDSGLPHRPCFVPVSCVPGHSCGGRPVARGPP